MNTSLKHSARLFSLPMIIVLALGAQGHLWSAHAATAGIPLAGVDWGAGATGLRGHNGARYLFVCPALGTFHSVWGTATYTDDSSVCTAAVHAGVLVVPIGGSVTIEIRPGSTAYTGSLRHGITSSSYGAWHGSFVIVAGHLGGVGTAKMGGGGWAATAAAFSAQNGARFSYICPPGGTAAAVWGTDMYSDDSSVCTAAVHVGLLTVANGGTVTVQIAPAMPSYLGYTWNGVATRMYGHWRASFLFPGTPMLLPRDPSIPIGGVSWSSAATSFRNQIGARYLFVCPPGGLAARVWGTDTYTDDSSVCTAAVHAGMLGFVQGGYLVVRISAGQSFYLGSARHGVTTKSYGRWGGSYTFVGSRAGSFK